MKIKTISFLYQNNRVYLKSNKLGRFMIPVVEVKRGKTKTYEKAFTAKEVVEHEKIIDQDPVLTLASGEKVRIFQGGDVSYMITYAASAIDAHDEASRLLEESFDWLEHGEFPFGDSSW